MLLRHLSFKTLLVASLFVVTLIPSLALVQTWWHLQQLAELVEQSQKQAEGLAELQRSYAEQSDLFERSTRQWNVLREEAFARTGKQALQSLQQLAGHLQQLNEVRLQQLGGRLAEWCVKSRSLLQGAAGAAEAWSRQYEELSRLGNELDSQVKRVSALQVRDVPHLPVINAFAERAKAGVTQVVVASGAGQRPARTRRAAARRRREGTAPADAHQSASRLSGSS